MQKKNGIRTRIHYHVFSGTSAYGEKPNVVNFAHGLVAGQLDAPLSSALVGGILPHWLDSLLEKMVVGADGEVAGLHDVVVNTNTEKRRYRAY